MFGWPKNNNTSLLSQLGVVIGGALLLCILLGTLSLRTLRLHYDNEQISAELTRLHSDPLLKKYSEEPELPERLDLDTLRGLSEKQQLEFVNSRAGENTLEIFLRGRYADFLDFLRGISLEYVGEIEQVELNSTGQVLEGKIVLKGIGNEK